MWNKAKPYAISSLIALSVGGLSALLTSKNMDLFDRIIKPPLAPPAILFPIVWTILYVLMGISAALVAKSDSHSFAKEKALATYAVSLAINFSWSIVFFNFRAFSTAFALLAVLFYFVVSTIIRYKKLSPLAAYLQIPYAGWLLFAGYLNFAIVILN